MKLISHRGNIFKRFPIYENEPEYIKYALLYVDMVEIDIWLIDSELYLGHDFPQFYIDMEFLLEHASSLLIHCKNIESFIYLYSFEQLNVFAHEQDSYVMTSDNLCILHPNTEIPHNVDVLAKTIIMCPEKRPNGFSEIFPYLDKVYGVCTDYCYLLKVIK